MTYCTRFSRLLLLSSVSISATFLAAAAQALPQDGTIAAGNVTIVTDGPNTRIQQGSDKAAIDWKSFNVGTQETVTFQQPSANSITLNRIHDQNPSQILGSIRANGQVILSNPNGMIFGKNSKVDVAGLVATTAGIGNDAFMQSGALKFTLPGKADATIVANGSITAKEAGLVALVAPRVEQNGLITAQLGKVQLAGAEMATVDLYGDGLLSIAVTDTAKSTSVIQNGTIKARYAALTAADASQLISSAVNVAGIIDANDARIEKDGTVAFGGRIEITARDVTLGESARLRAAGRNGGGTVKVGGGWQGNGTIANAKNTTVKAGAKINASATEKGDGGIVAVWSDNTTQFDGTITAKGGPKDGNGGKVETSGKQRLGVSGNVDASATHGLAGDWLLDPQNVQITTSGANSVPAGGGTYNPSGATDPYTILDSSISTALSNGNNVTITTVNAGQAQTGNISLAGATIAKTGGGDATLTLKADNSIITSSTNSISSSVGKLHTILWSDADNSTAGAIRLDNTSISTNGGDIVMAGGLDNGANGGTVGDGRPDNFSTTTGSYGLALGQTVKSVLDAGGGNIVLIGKGAARGIFISDASQILTSVGGTIDMIGTSTGGGTLSYGIALNNGALVQSENGTIRLTGDGSGGSTTNIGIDIESVNTSIKALGSGNIILKATSPGGVFDLYAPSASQVISSKTGDITFNVDNLHGSLRATISTEKNIIIKPRTPGTSIGISGGTCGGTCGINLNDTLLPSFQPDSDGDGIGSLIVGDSAAGTGTVDINGWDISGKTYDVQVYGGTVDFTGNMIWNGGNDLLFHSRAGSIVIDQNFSRNSGAAGNGTLTLKASDSITSSGVNTITAATTGATGKLNTILWSDANNDLSGYISLSTTTFTTNGGDVVMAGGVDNGADIFAATDGTTLLYDGIASDGRPDSYAWGNGGSTIGVKLSNVDITSGAGSIVIRGHGMTDTSTASHYGAYIYNGSLFETDGGSITVDGVGGDSSITAYGAIISDSGTILRSTTGAISLNGLGGTAAGDSNHGLIIQSSASLSSIGTGSTAAPINIYGKAAGSGSFNYGLYLSAAGTVSSTDGDINIVTVGGNGVNSNHSFRFSNANITTNGDANITISGTRGAGASSGDLWIATASSNIGGPSATGTITFLADKIGSFIDVTAQTQGSIVFKPRTPGTTIGVSGGTCGSACGLVISDAILALVSPDVDGNGIGSLIIGDSAAGTGTVDINGWDISGKTYDVEVYGGIVDFTGNMIWNGPNDLLFYSRTGTLTIDNNFNRNAGTAGDGTLTLKSTNSIATSGGGRSITAASGATSGKLNTILWGDADNSGAGRVYYGASSINTNGGDIIMAGGLDDGSNNGIAADGRPDGFAIGADAIGAEFASTADIYSGNGNILIRGRATGSTVVYGMLLSNTAKIRSDGGNIQIFAESFSSAANAHGMAINSGGLGTTSITSVTGDITVNSSYLGASGSVGIVLWGEAKIATTGSGDVTMILRSDTTTDFFANAGSALPSQIGDALMTGDITMVMNDTMDWNSNLTFLTQGDLIIKPRTAGTPINIAGGGGLNLFTNDINTFSARNITIGDATSGLITINPYPTWSSRASNSVNFVSGNGITFAAGAHNFGTRTLNATTPGTLAVNGALTVGSTLLRSTAVTSDITIGSTGSIASSQSGDAITLVSGRNFVNNRGATAFTTTGGGRWQVFSADPGSNANGGLAADFTRFGCTYSTCVGLFPSYNGFLYSTGSGAGSAPSGGTGGGDPLPPAPPALPENPGIPEAPSLPEMPVGPTPDVITGFIGQLDRITLTQTAEPAFIWAAETGATSDYTWTTERLFDEEPLFENISTEADKSATVERNFGEYPLFSLSRALKIILQTSE